MSYTTCYNQTLYPIAMCEVTDQTECAQMNQAVAITPKFTAMLSMIGASLIIYRFIVMKPKNRKTYDRLMLGMSIMNFWGSLGFFLGQWTFPSIPAGALNSPFCSWQGWLLQINAAVYWYNGVLATNFILRIKFGWSDDRVRKIEPYMHLVAWFYPTVTSFVALGLNMYGKSGPWCWISVKYDWARWAFFFAELWAVMIYTTICMIVIVITVKRSDDQTAFIRDSQTSTTSNSNKPKKKGRLGKKTRQVAIQAALYVATFLLTWIFGTANRIQNAIVANTPGAVYCNVFALVWLHSLFVPAQGFFNFIVYLYPRWVEAERKKKERQRERSVSDHDKEPCCTRLNRVIKESCLESFAVIFGREKFEKSESQHDSGPRGQPPSNRRDRNKRNANQGDNGNNVPSNAQSGEAPSEPNRTQNDDEEDDEEDSNSEQQPLKPEDQKSPGMQEQNVNDVNSSPAVATASTVASPDAADSDGSRDAKDVANGQGAITLT